MLSLLLPSLQLLRSTFSELRKCRAEDHPAFSQTLVLSSEDQKSSGRSTTPSSTRKQFYSEWDAKYGK